MILADIAKLIRSKNAGPFTLTFDIMFADLASYRRVKDSGALNPAVFAKLYRCPFEKVRFFECENALAFKFSIPRPLTQGELGDGDMHGGQQFIPLMSVEIP
jgi:Domain of unknown function (DUF4387)